MSQPDYLPDLRELPCGEDPDLLPEEKQVSFTTTKRDGAFTVHSEMPVISRYLIDHPSIEVRDARVVDGYVVAVTAVMPRGLMDLKAKPRTKNHLGRMVSTAELRGLESE